jgi:hypothetical protein
MKIIEKILERFLGFFTIFDVSYMISGIATLSIVLWGLFKCQGLLWNDVGFVHVVYFLVLAYLCGLVSFAFGKGIRSWFMKKNTLWCKKQTSFMYCFTAAITYVNSQKQANEKKLIVYDEQWRAEMYYAEMWYFLREKKNESMTFSLLNKYWVSQAIYDGLLFSAILATFQSLIMWYKDFLAFGTMSCIFLFSIITLICLYKEGKRYAETQIKEVVIAYNALIN